MLSTNHTTSSAAETQAATFPSVRRHNGQCAYGPWMPADSDDAPEWVREYVAAEIADGSREGRVSQGGSIWLFRTA